jgi:hypothetical protein
VTVIVWWSSSASLIAQRTTRRGRGAHRSNEGGTATLARLARGEGSGGGRSWCGEDGARAGPFIGARGREKDGGDGEHQRARHDGGNGANAD